MVRLRSGIASGSGFSAMETVYAYCLRKRARILNDMPRQKTPEGKRNTWCAKLTDAEHEAAEAAVAASGLVRSEWLRSLILGAISRPAEPA